jgi:hypothetical protein
LMGRHLLTLNASRDGSPRRLISAIGQKAVVNMQ